MRQLSRSFSFIHSIGLGIITTIAFSQPSHAIEINQYNGYVQTHSAARRIPEPKAVIGLTTVGLLLWHRQRNLDSSSR